LAKKRIQTSKVLLWATGLLFASQLFSGNVYALLGKDISIFCYTIPSTGGVFGAAAIFYYKKAEAENLSKGRLKLTFLRWKMTDVLPPETMAEFEREINTIDEQFDAKLQSSLSEAVQKDISIQNY